MGRCTQATFQNGLIFLNSKTQERKENIKFCVSPFVFALIISSKQAGLGNQRFRLYGWQIQQLHKLSRGMR